ncbi:dTMP kinase, partial [Micromonospora chalcea]|uniref:dTMP kinase n=1 Tax=Micromonospora chalcea TaxID=1874 RepID=UPI003826277F
MTGLFVVVDGPSGVGKTTASALLVRLLAQEGWPVHPTKEPSNSVLGRTARHGTDEYRGLTLACLVAADRYHHLETEVRPALKAGKVVVCDRYLPTSLVLQRLDGVEPDFIWRLNRHADRPDLILQPGMLTSAELRFGAVGVRGQPPSIMGGCVD